jgi:hypothetical protein
MAVAGLRRAVRPEEPLVSVGDPADAGPGAYIRARIGPSQNEEGRGRPEAPPSRLSKSLNAKNK